MGLGTSALVEGHVGDRGGMAMAGDRDAARRRVLHRSTAGTGRPHCPGPALSGGDERPGQVPRGGLELASLPGGGLRPPATGTRSDQRQPGASGVTALVQRDRHGEGLGHDLGFADRCGERRAAAVRTGHGTGSRRARTGPGPGRLELSGNRDRARLPASHRGLPLRRTGFVLVGRSRGIARLGAAGAGAGVRVRDEPTAGGLPDEREVALSSAVLACTGDPTLPGATR